MILIGQVQSRNESIKIPCFSCSIMQQNTALLPDNHLGMFGSKNQKIQSLEDKVKTLESKIQESEAKIKEMQDAEPQGLSALNRRVELLEISGRATRNRLFDNLATKEEVQAVEKRTDEHARVLSFTISSTERHVNGRMDTQHGLILKRLKPLEKNQDRIWQRIEEVEHILQMNRREQRGLDKA